MDHPLFETNAIQVAPYSSPFFYTSGLIGPYFVNTHYVVGGKEKANEVLGHIDAGLPLSNRGDLIATLNGRLGEIYHNHPLYRNVIDQLGEVVASLPKVEYISGGERRDWLFGPLVAAASKLPYLYIFKDKEVRDQTGEKFKGLPASKWALHIGDLLNTGSSYVQKWIPALFDVNIDLVASVNVTDRLEGGAAFLHDSGVAQTKSLYHIDEALFAAALKQEYIDGDQFTLVRDYLEDPRGSMRKFLQENPQFLIEALASPDQKTKERAEKLVKEDLYALN